MAHRSFKFFLPKGEIDPLKGNNPLGLYQATRRSLAAPNKIIRSAFLFYENSETSERLEPYNKYIGARILRFKEFRHISIDKRKPYSILGGGLVLWNRQCFIAIGATYETSVKKPEYELDFSDIDHVQTVFYIFDDDNNSEIVRGIKPAILRMEGDPVSPIVQLEFVRKFSHQDWLKQDLNEHVEIGVLNSDELGDQALLKKGHA